MRFCRGPRLPLLALGIFAAACGGDAQSAQPAASAGTTPTRSPTSRAGAQAEFTVDTMTVDVPLELPAQLYVEHDAAVVARSAGTIDSLFAELGDEVPPGRLLAKLESEPQEIALAAAAATYDNLLVSTTRARALVKSGGMTIADSEQIASQLRQADIARRKARYDLDLTRIVAPFAGVVTSRLARPHRFVAVGDTLFRVTESSPLLARVRVPEGSAQNLHNGVAVVVVASDGATIGGRVIHTSPIVDAASGTREAVIELASHGAALMPGASVSVRLAHGRQRLVVVPRAAIAADDFAVVVDAERSTVRAVTIGRALGQDRVEVISGLSPGERLARPPR